MRLDSVSLPVVHTSYTPCEMVYHPEKNGIQYLFRFENGYGASVVYHDFSYGLELACIEWLDNENFKLVYNKDFPDVVGHCSNAEVEVCLKKIKKYKGKVKQIR